MIEFNLDGPCGTEANGRVPLRVLGIGQTGISTLDQLVLHGHNQFDLWALDTDMETLDGSVVREKMLLGRDALHGLGTSGEVESARECLIENVEELKLAASGCQHLAIIVGLGGGTGAAIAPHLVDLATEDGARVIVIAATPFGFESRRRHDQAQRALSRMRANADAVLVFGNDQLLEMESGRVNLRHAFPHQNRLMSSCLDSLGQMMVSDGLINLSFADMRSLFGRFAGTEVMQNCWAGHGEATAKDGAEMLVDDVLASPFIPEDVLEYADHAMLCLTGGEDLSLQEVQAVLDELKTRLPEDFPIATNANMDVEAKGRLRASLMLSVTRTPTDAVPVSEEEVPGEELPFTAEPEEVAEKVEEPVAPVAPVVMAEPTPPAMPVEKLVPTISGDTQKITLPPIYEEEPAEIDEPAEVLAHDAAVAEAGEQIESEPEEQSNDFADAFDADDDEEWSAEEAGVAPITAAQVVAPPKVSPLLDHVQEEAEPQPPVEEHLPVEPQIAEPVAAAVAAPVAAKLPTLEAEPEVKGQLPLMHEPVIMPDANKGRQGELQLEQVSRGRFEKTQETIYNGENLDQPTFRRRGLVVQL